MSIDLKKLKEDYEMAKNMGDWNTAFTLERIMEDIKNGIDVTIAVKTNTRQ